MLDLKVGDVVFVMHNDNFISKLFSKVMGSKWSHSAVVYGHINGKTLLCETSDFEVTLNFFDRYVSDDQCSFEVVRHPHYENVIAGNEEIIHSACDDFIGEIYGYLQLISLAIRRLFKLKIINFFRQGLVCCHVVGYALRGIHGSGFEAVDPEGYDTEEMYQMLKRQGWVTVLSRS